LPPLSGSEHGISAGWEARERIVVGVSGGRKARADSARRAVSAAHPEAI